MDVFKSLAFVTFEDDKPRRLVTYWPLLFPHIDDTGRVREVVCRITYAGTDNLSPLGGEFLRIDYLCIVAD